MSEVIKVIEKQNKSPKEENSLIKVTSIFNDKGKTFQEAMEDIIRNASCKQHGHFSHL